jgi:hypothetical protein
VDNAVQKVVQAIESGTTPKKFILMSTTAYTNKKLHQKCVNG